MKSFGRVHEICPKVEGETENGFWVRQTLVIEKEDGRFLAVGFFGESKVKRLAELKPGKLVKVEYTIASKQVGERWFTELQGQSVTSYEPTFTPNAETLNVQPSEEATEE